MENIRRSGRGEEPRALTKARMLVWLGDVVVAAVILGATFIPFPGTDLAAFTPVTLALTIAPAIILPFRRRWPLAVLLTCLALYVTLAMLGLLSPGAAWGVSIAMFSYSNRATRKGAILVGLAVLAIMIAFSLSVAEGNVTEANIFQYFFAVAFAVAAGDAARSGRAYVTAITERAEIAERTREAEARRRVAEVRLQIARDLHDAVAHQIAVISLNAGVATSMAETNPEKTKAALGTIRQASRTVLNEIGGLLTLLRAEDRIDTSLSQPRPGLEHLDGLLAQFKSVGFDVRSRIEGDLLQVPERVSSAAYRILQEALTNAHKHSSDPRAHLLITVADVELRIVVRNPVTQEAPASQTGTGMGLVGIREQASFVHGTIETESGTTGWKLIATIPLDSKETPC